MSEQTGTYKIRIETEQTGDGAAKTAADLKKVSQAAGESGENLGKASRELRHILTQAGGGELAELLRAATGPMIIGEGIIQIYKEVVKGIQAAREQQLKLVTDAENAREAHQKLADTIRNDLLDSLNKAAIHAAHFRDAYDAAAKAADLLEKHQENISAAAERAADAQERITLATIAASQASGLITPLQADIQRDQAELDAKKRKEAAENKRDLDTATRKDVRAADDEAASRANRARADAARAPGGALEQLSEEIATTKSIIDSFKKSHPEAMAAANQAKAWIATHGGETEEGQNAFRRKLAQGGLSPEGVGYENKLTAALSAIAHANATDPSGQENHLKELQRQYDALDANVKKWDASADRQSAAADELFDAAEELRQAVADRAPGQNAENNAIAAANNIKEDSNAARNFTDKAVKDFGNAIREEGSRPGYNPNFTPNVNAEFDVAQGHVLLEEIRAGFHIPASTVKLLVDAIKQVHGESQDAKLALDNMSAVLSANLGH